MKLRQGLIKVLSGNIIAQLLTGAFGLYLINIMPINAYANYILYQSMIFLVTGLLVNPFNRILLVSGDSRLLEWLLPLQFCLMLIVSLFSYFYFSSDILLWVLFLFVSLSLLVFEYYKGISQKALEFGLYRRIVSGRAFAFVLVGFFTITLLSNNSQDYLYLVVVSSLVTYVFSLIVLYYNRPIKLFTRVPSRLEIRYIFGKYGFLFGYFLLSAVFSQLDFLFLRFYSSSHELATYGASFQYYLFLMIVMNSLKQVLLPVLVKDSAISFITMTKSLVPVYMVFSIIVILLIVTFKYWAGIIEMGKYERTDLVFSILATSLIFSMLCSPASEFMQVAGRFRSMCFILLISMICNISLNYQLVDEYGAAGVAASTLVSFLLLNLLFVITSYRLDVNKTNY